MEKRKCPGQNSPKLSPKRLFQEGLNAFNLKFKHVPNMFQTCSTRRSTVDRTSSMSLSEVSTEPQKHRRKHTKHTLSTPCALARWPPAIQATRLLKDPAPTAVRKTWRSRASVEIDHTISHTCVILCHLMSSYVNMSRYLSRYVENRVAAFTGLNLWFKHTLILRITSHYI
jgi:hypothetical protein